MKKILTFTFLLVALLLTSCSISPLTLIETIVNDTAVALPILEAAGVPVPPVVVTYVGDVAACIANTQDVTLAQIRIISGCLSAQVAPLLPAGTPQTIVAIITTVLKDVETYITAYPPPFMKSGTAKIPTKLTKQQTKKLVQLRSRALEVVSRCRNFYNRKAVQ